MNICILLKSEAKHLRWLGYIYAGRGWEQGGDLVTFSDQAEEENWMGSNYYFSDTMWIGLRQYDAEGTEGQVRLDEG